MSRPPCSACGKAQAVRPGRLCNSCFARGLMNKTIQTLALTVIEVDPDLQARVGMYDDVVQEYAEALRNDVFLPPVVVFFDGEKYWLADGFHRLRAALLAELDEIDCDIRQGTRRDAKLFAAGANKSHGLRRCNADKRRAVQVMFSEKEWLDWSDRRIAEHCGVSDTFVGTLRSETFPAKRATANGSHSRIGKDGRTYKVKPATQSDMFPAEPAGRILCERCQRVGAVQNCAACKRLRSPFRSTGAERSEETRRDAPKPSPEPEAMAPGSVCPTCNRPY